MVRNRLLLAASLLGLLVPLAPFAQTLSAGREPSAPTSIEKPPPNVSWDLGDNVAACPAGDSVVAGHPSRLRIHVVYSDANFHVKNGVPPESIWAIVKPVSGTLKVNDEALDEFGSKVFAGDSTGGGAAWIVVPSMSGCGTVRVTVWVSNVSQGFKNANVRTVDTDADVDRRVTTSDQTGVCDLNYDGVSNSTDVALVTAHLNHWHHLALHGSLARRTNLCETCSPGNPNTMGSGDISWSPDGATLAYSSHNSSGNCSLKLVASDPKDGNTIIELTNPPVGVEDYDPSWSPQGDFVTWDRDDEELYKKDPSSPSNPDVVVYDSGTPSGATQGAVSPDGLRIAFCGIGPSGFQNLKMVNMDGTGFTMITNLTNVADQWPKWSPDGSTLTFFRFDYTTGQTTVWSVPSTGGTATQLFAPTGGSTSPSYTPDGRVIVCGATSNAPITTSFEPALGLTAPGIAAYPAYTAFLLSPRISPDGSRLALIARTPGIGPSFSPQLWAARRNMSLPPAISTVGGFTVNNARPVVNFTATPGTTLNVTVNASDPEAEPLTYVAYFMRTDLGMTFTPATRTFSWNAPIGASDSTYYVRLQVTTPSGGTDYAILKILVADRMPPAAITNLQPFFGHTTAVLTWNSPGDNGNVGNATAFDLRYSSSPIDEGSFGSATPIPTGSPGSPGTLNCAELSGLSPCSGYWFAIKTVDDAGNWSNLSNVPSGQEHCSGFELACGGPQDGGAAPPTIQLPTALTLEVQGANPTRSATDLRYGIPSGARGAMIEFGVFDVLGRRVRSLRNERGVPGWSTMRWDLRSDSGQRVAPGFYYLRVASGAQRVVKGLLVLN